MFTALYDITPCRSVEAANMLQESAASVLYTENGDGRIYQKQWWRMKIYCFASSSKVPALLSDFYKV
jgi:hypothetical protein